MNDNLMENDKSDSLSALGAEIKAQAIRQKIKWTTLRAMAIVFWVYALLKLFIFDVDVLLIRRLFPNATWLIEYRGVVTLAIIAILALVMWNRKLLGAFLYIAFFPFIVAVFHVPLWLIRRRSWMLMAVLLAATMSMLRSLRSIIILSGLFVVGITFIVVGTKDFLLWLGMGFLVLFIAGIYFRTIKGAFRSSLDIFSPQSLDKLWRAISQGYTPSDEKGNDIQTMTDSEKTTWITQLQFSVLFNRICYFIADKLIILRQGRVLAAIAGMKITWLFVVTLLVFSMLNFGLYKFDPMQFLVTGTAKGFDFLWYTFQTSFVNNVLEIIPAGVLARSLFMANGITSGLILFILVVFFLTGVQTARSSDQINTMADTIREQGKDVELFVLDVFGLTITAAIEELVRVRAIMADWIVQMSPDVDPNLTKSKDNSDQGEFLEESENEV